MTSPFKGFYLFLCGVCMGAADLIPGISGGTIAFIMGFYQTLLESLKSFNGTTLRLLLTFQWKGFSQQTGWRFLLTLGSGIAFSFLVLSSFIHWILEQEIYRSYLYAAFMGLILASFIICIRELKRWTLLEGFGLIVGVLSAYALTGSLEGSPETGPYAIERRVISSVPLENYDQENGLLTQLTAADLSALLAKNEIEAATPIYTAQRELLGPASAFTHPYQPAYIDWWLICCGAVAVCALLLPGISGSYLLTLLGVYPQAIGALAELIAHLKQGSVDGEALIILGNLFVGIVMGAICFSRVASWLLRKYPDMSLAVLSGFMIGALRSVWPFWTYAYTLLPLKLHKGPQLLALEPTLPPLFSFSFLLAAFCTAAGFALVLFLESIASSKKERVC